MSNEADWALTEARERAAKKAEADGDEYVALCYRNGKFGTNHALLAIAAVNFLRTNLPAIRELRAEVERQSAIIAGEPERMRAVVERCAVIAEYDCRSDLAKDWGHKPE